MIFGALKVCSTKIFPKFEKNKVDNNFSEVRIKGGHKFFRSSTHKIKQCNSVKLMSNIYNFGKFTVEHHFSAPKIMQFRIFSTSAILVESRRISSNFPQFWSNFAEVTICRISIEGSN